MRRMMLYSVLTAFIVVAFTPLVMAQNDPEYFASLFKDYLEDIEQKNYVKAWESLTASSKYWIARLVADRAVQQGKNVTRSQVYFQFENDSSGMRTAFFDRLNTNWQKNGFFSKMRAAKFTVKSVTKDRAVVNIMEGKENRDFLAVHERDSWRVNFFEDLMRD